MIILNQVRDEVYTMALDTQKAINTIEAVEQENNFSGNAYPKIGRALDLMKETKQAMDEYGDNMEMSQSQMLGFLQEVIYFDGDISRDMNQLLDPVYMKDYQDHAYNPSTEEITKLLQDPQWSIFAGADIDILVRAIEAMNEPGPLARKQAYEELLAALNARELERAKAKFTGVGGIGYNWDNILATLQKPSKYITEYEYAALAEMYTSMDPEDMERFVRSLAENTGSMEKSYTYVTPAEVYSTWEFDPDKIENLRKYLSVYANSLYMEAKAYDEADYAAFGTGLTAQEFEKQMGDLAAGLRGKADEVEQKNSLLVALLNTIGGKPLVGLTPDTPAITLTRVDGEYLITFNEAGAKVSSGRGYAVPMVENPYGVGTTLPSISTGKETIKIVGAFFDEKFGFNLGEEIAKSLSGFSGDQAKDNVYNSIPDILEKNLGLSSIGKIAGKFPLVGDLIEAGLGIADSYQESQKNMYDSKLILEALEDREYILYFDLNSNLITSKKEGNASDVSLVVYPSENTYAKFEWLKNYIESNHINLADYGLYSRSSCYGENGVGTESFNFPAIR
jgi:hypothetical protein